MICVTFHILSAFMLQNPRIVLQKLLRSAWQIAGVFELAGE